MKLNAVFGCCLSSIFFFGTMCLCTHEAKCGVWLLIEFNIFSSIAVGFKV